MTQKNRTNKVVMYFQVIIVGLILVLSPCSVRNSLQEHFLLEKTDVTNKSKTTKDLEEFCFATNLDGENSSDIINTTPESLSFSPIQHKQLFAHFTTNTDLTFKNYVFLGAVKDNAPLYLLYQQFRTHTLKI